MPFATKSFVVDLIPGYRPFFRRACFVCALALMFGASACSGTGIFTEEDKLDPGRCNFHTDCKDGQKCHNTYCEDIYYPEREIKTF